MAGIKRSLQSITTRNLKSWKDLIIPVIYEELDLSRKELEDNYFCIGVKEGSDRAGALIAHIEPETGDVQIISIYVLPEFRRRGHGSALVKALSDLMSSAFRFAYDELSSQIFIKTMYSLPAEYRKNYEAFLKAAGFTQFYIFKKAAGRKPALCGADAELRIYNLKDGDL